MKLYTGKKAPKKGVCGQNRVVNSKKIKIVDKFSYICTICAKKQEKYLKNT